MCCGGKDEDSKEREANYRKANYSDPNYEGEPMNAAFAKGPAEKRHCTDICCCMIFIAFCVGMGYVAMIGLADGDPKSLKNTYDADSNPPPITFHNILSEDLWEIPWL